MNHASDYNACIAYRLSRAAAAQPEGIAVAEAISRGQDLLPEYQTTTFAQLDSLSDRIARGLMAWGITPGMRLVLLVPFSSQFIGLVLGLMKAGVVVALVDPGMGRSKILGCLAELQPDGFVTVPRVQWVRAIMRRRFPQAVWNVTAGPRWTWPGMTLDRLQRLGRTDQPLPKLAPDDPAAVIFTTGSTGPPKGVLYTHGMFNQQVDLIQRQYGIRAGDRDLACFPLFGLFDAVMGVTTIIPEMNPMRPADVDGRKILHAIETWKTTHAFGSPALWTKVVRYCETERVKIPHLRKVLSAGAPVSPFVLQGMRSAMVEEGEIHTPYGATESLPVASIESREVLGETAAKTQQGSGTCVGRLFPTIEWRVIKITDAKLSQLQETEELPPGEIGELMVAGPVVTQRYVTRTDQNALHKVADGDRFWHRVGDVGYLDELGRFWFCGRKSHRVETERGILFTEPCEAIVNSHPHVYRSALVGIGPRPRQTPCVIVEPWGEHRPRDQAAESQLVRELRELLRKHPLTQTIEHVAVYPQSLPVDIRHNSKIFREQLVLWGASKLGSQQHGQGKSGEDDVQGRRPVS